MTTLDDRARTAVRELREAADRREVPTTEVLLGRDRSAHRPLLAVAAAVVLVVVAAAVLVGRGDDTVDLASVPDGVPAGVVPAEWSPGNLGLTVQVPDGWREAGPLSGFAHSMVSGDGAYVLSTLVLDQEERSVGEFVEARRRELEGGSDATTGPAEPIVVDGHEGVVWSFRLSNPAPGPDGFAAAALLEYVVDVGNRLRLLVSIGEPLPVDQEPLREWIASTIEVGEASVDIPSVEHPGPTTPPAGVAPTAWEPVGLGLSLDVPGNWTAELGFDHGVSHARGGGATEPFVLAERLPAATGSPEARAAARARDSEEEVSAEVVVDGRPATVTRYSLRLGDAGASTQVEYVVELGDGTFAVLTFGYPVTSPTDVTDWIRSTIRLTA